MSLPLLTLAALLVIWLAWRLGRRSKHPLAYLYQVNDAHPGRFDIKTDVCRIGRNPDNDIRLSDKSVSRYHVELVHNKKGTFDIFDISSKHGLRVVKQAMRSSALPA